MVGVIKNKKIEFSSTEEFIKFSDSLTHKDNLLEFSNKASKKTDKFNVERKLEFRNEKIKSNTTR